MYGEQEVVVVMQVDGTTDLTVVVVDFHLEKFL